MTRAFYKTVNFKRDIHVDIGTIEALVLCSEILVFGIDYIDNANFA